MLPAQRHTGATEDEVTAWALGAAAGDANAFEHVFRALHHDVRRYVTALADDSQVAEDLVQETFLRAVSTVHLFQGRGSARAWLLTIARRAVVDSLRRAASRPRLADTPDWQFVAERSQPRDLPGFDEGIALMSLVEALPDDRREAFVLTQLLDMPYDDAARTSACPVGTIRSRVSRARTTLCAMLDDRAEPVLVS
ncbi:sigma-70 family RNA polymerase sigma factor [Streptomyces sp. Cmuel-A718b]|uniref:sigma-70 family RNA polymerase sigma factor n=1 Tax=unclassified Streptomyces TaxID=2593676 RepID=UPI00081EF884|nr:sigma-70 family RNA polymerase sigma factor [Streptomyces sp. Cmuel-A718b]OSC76358.1 RNA polymerase subunit sigma [Streptomyces sp. BF-3]SCF58625.1 RNA polymerase sigma-70 factor, ECF subfamily [Streptomyces sp. Cmuel-A718b]